MSELDEIKEDIKELKKEVGDIKDNHIQSVWDALGSIWGNVEDLAKDCGHIKDGVKNLRWFILGGFAILAIVVAILAMVVTTVI